MLTKILCIALIYVAFVQTNAEHREYDGQLPAAYYEEIDKVDLPVKVAYHISYDLSGNPVAVREKYTHRRHHKKTKRKQGGVVGGFIKNLFNVGRSTVDHGVDNIDEKADSVLKAGKSFLHAGKSLAESSLDFWTSLPKAGLEAVQRYDDEEEEEEEEEK